MKDGVMPATNSTYLGRQQFTDMPPDDSAAVKKPKMLSGIARPPQCYGYFRIPQLSQRVETISIELKSAAQRTPFYRPLLGWLWNISSFKYATFEQLRHG